MALSQQSSFAIQLGARPRVGLLYSIAVLTADPLDVSSNGVKTFLAIEGRFQLASTTVLGRWYRIVRIGSEFGLIINRKLDFCHFSNEFDLAQ